MKKICLITICCLTFILPFKSNAQFNDDKIGAWYMYFWNTNFNESRWGLQGDVQYRNWNLIGDLEQLLLRGGVTYSPKNTNVKLTLGYANITTGAFGDSNSTTSESRIYQEALLPQKIGNRIYLTHRFRYEQRFVDNQDFRTRYRYNLFVNVGLTNAEIKKGSLYLALYNEVFINGERQIGDGNSVQYFDRNRLYTGFGYAVNDRLKVQFGTMRQKTNSWNKTQLQLSLHHKF